MVKSKYTFEKRQKENARLQKKKEKLARRLEAKESGIKDVDQDSGSEDESFSSWWITIPQLRTSPVIERIEIQIFVTLMESPSLMIEEWAFFASPWSDGNQADAS